MNDLFKSFSSYNLLTNFVPGAIFVYLLNYINNDFYDKNNIAMNIISFFFFGLILSRVGSIIIEPMFKSLGIVKPPEYSRIASVQISSNDDLLNTLIESSYMYRTLVALFLVNMFVVIIFYSINIDQNLIARRIVFMFWSNLVLLMLFIFSYQKQTAYVVQRLDALEKFNRVATPEPRPER